jgi:hypothetical protein
MPFRLFSISMLLMVVVSGSGCASMSGWGGDCCYDGCVDAGCGRSSGGWGGGGWGSMFGGSRRCCPTACDPCCDPCGSQSWALPTYDGVSTTGTMPANFGGGCANCQQGQPMQAIPSAIPGTSYPATQYPPTQYPAGTTFEQGTWSNEMPPMSTPGGAALPVGPTPAATPMPAGATPVSPATPATPAAPPAAVTPTAFSPAVFTP